MDEKSASGRKYPLSLVCAVVGVPRSSYYEHQRKLRTIVCRTGLTRSGVFGSALGRPRGR